MWKEFREFAVKGSVLDMAVGIIIGAAFGKIVTSLVEDVIMPPIGLVLGKVDFTNLFIALNGEAYASLAEAKKAGAPTINYGQFANHIISFAIVAFAVFLLVKAVNRWRAQPAPAPEQRQCGFCKMPVADDAVRCPHCTSQLGSA